MRADALTRKLCLLAESQVQSLSFDNGASQRLLEYRQTDVSADLNVFANAVGGTFRVDLLRKPDSKLRHRERQKVPLSGTWTYGFQGKSRTALEVRKQHNWTCS